MAKSQITKWFSLYLDNFLIKIHTEQKFMPQFCTASAYANVLCSLEQMQYRFVVKFWDTQ